MIVHGIGNNEVVNAVREDPARRGLLFCGTERAVYVSFNDGDDWQPLRLNMPATSIRDLVIHGDDLIVGTHGRSFWILDDITPLRQFDPRIAEAPAHLYRPQIAYRMRRSRNTDTPLPPEEPMGQNPPDGAIIDYGCKDAHSGPVSLEVLDSQGRRVRRFAGDDTAEVVDEKELDVPFYWVRQPRTLPSGAGMHRWIWDLRYAPPDVPARGLPISAIYKDTPRGPQGPFVAPGRYTVRLTVDGQSYTQPLTVKPDPRITTPPAQVALQHRLSMQVYEGIQQCAAAIRQIQALRTQTSALKSGVQGDAAASIEALESKLAGLAGAGSSAPARRRSLTGDPNFEQVRSALAGLLDLLQSTDRGPTTQATAAVEAQTRLASSLIHQWSEIAHKDLPTLNERLRAAGIPPLPIPTP